MTQQELERNLRSFQRDRMVVYAILIVIAAIPLAFPFSLPLTITPETQQFYDFIDAIPDDSYVWFAEECLGADVGQVFPQMISVFSHLFEVKNVKIVILQFSAEAGSAIMETRVIPPTNILGRYVYGVDYIDLGYQAGGEVGVAAFALDVNTISPTDYFGNIVADMPIWENIPAGGKDFYCVIQAGSTWEIQMYQRQVKIPYGTPTYDISKAGNYITDISSVQAGTLDGFLDGIVMAAEYEIIRGVPGIGLAQQNALTFICSYIVVLIIAVNVKEHVLPRLKTKKETM